MHYIESSSTNTIGLEEIANELVYKHDCSFLGFADAKTSLFPPSYSVHENEVHAALRNRTAKLGGNVVVANFYKKPAQGIALNCPHEFF